MKITVIGGGSYLWTPLLVNDVLLSERLRNVQLYLFDINENNLQDMNKLSLMVKESLHSDVTIKSTMNIDEALDGSDFVIVQIAVGGFDAMKYDLEIPSKYGIYQSVGDTVGPGGMARGIRNALVFMDYARRIDKLCPKAWVINLTNPLTILSRVFNLSGIKVVGLCHEVGESIERLSKLFEISQNDFEYDVIGINHLPWITNMKIKGDNGFNLLRKYIENGKYDDTFINNSTNPYISKMQVAKELFNIFEVFPAASDRHICEFFPYFLRDVNFKKLEGEYKVRLTTINRRKAERKKLIEFYKNILNKELKMFKKSYKPHKSGENVIEVIDSIYNGRNENFVADVPNDGAIKQLPLNVVVETKVSFKNGKINLLSPQSQYIPNNLLGILMEHITNQEEVVKATFERNRKKAFTAFINDPLTSVLPLKSIKDMFNELWDFSMNEKWVFPPYHIGKNP
jgi:alpha-galactosidase